MEIVILVLVGLLLIAGVIGSFMPVLPGPPIAYGALLLLHYFTQYQTSSSVLIWTGVAMVIITVVDNLMSIFGAKKFGAGKAGMIGSFVGLFLGLSFGPIGIIGGPLVGAIVGELIAGKNSNDALKAGIGTFIGFLCGTLLKLIYAGYMIYLIVSITF